MPVNEIERPGGRRAASHYLHQLLLKPGDYRQAWEQHVVRTRNNGQINQMAVAEVLARHLRTAPRRPADAEITPHQLKDTVSRALSGNLSRPALSLFVDALGLTEHEEDRLLRLWSGSAAITVLAGSHAMPARDEQEVSSAMGPRRHQTLTLHDHVWVGADGRLDRDRTTQVIEASADGVDRVPVMFDANVLTIEAGPGCTALSGQLRQVATDVFAAEMLLSRTLSLGETATLEYWTTYRYPGDPDDPQERQYRRAVMRRLEHFDMRVEFDPGRLPVKVWWARWDGVEGGVLEQQAIALDSQHSAHHYVSSFEKAVAGFHWSWH